MDNKLQQKWDSIYQKKTLDSLHVSKVLADNTHLLPQQGLALELACGQGANTFHLAQQGLDVDAWDISTVAIEKIKSNPSYTANIKPLVRDLTNGDIPKAHYDVIVVSRFLQRDLTSKIIAALKPQGLLFYQTFIIDKTQEIGPSNELFLLAENELLTLFSPLTEEGSLGDTQQGFRNEAMLIAKR